MRIIVPAIGSRGDVQPYIALCQGLQLAGHDVILATNPTMTALVQSCGVKVAPIGPAVDMGAEGAKLWEKSGSNLWLGLIRVMQLASRLLEQSYPDLLEVCRGADLVVVSDPTAGAAEADRLGIPWISVTLQPGRIPVSSAAPTIGRRLLSLVFTPVSKLMVAPINAFRRRVGAPLVRDISSMMSSRLILFPVSRHVAPPEAGWARQVRSTGYWFSRDRTDWQPPRDLQAFLETGPAPIAISLGAMSLSGDASRQAAGMALQAVQLAGVRAIVQGWDETLSGTMLPEGIFHTGSLPHAWLFQRVCAVVHHGGFGTTASTLRAGLPGIVVPHIIDQFYWAQRVTELGAGLKIPRAELSAEKLAAFIRRAAADVELRRNAATLGEEIRAEPDGVTTAVRCIEASN